MPANRLTEQERKQIIEISCGKEFCDRPPSQIVPILADRGEYIASEATFYRVLKAEQMLAHRGMVSPKKHTRPSELVATKPNEVWSWDITYLKTSVLGRFFYFVFGPRFVVEKLLALNLPTTRVRN